MSNPVINMVGLRLGAMVVVARAPNAKTGQARWECRCDCGNVVTVSGSNLRSGRSRSCGCLKGHVISEKKTRHGHCRGGHRTPEYRAWTAAINRCADATHPYFADYGGRGIRVCADWRASFEAFLAHVGPRPSSQHSLDRFPDHDGNYEPGNVRWATRTEQNRNTRTNHIVTAAGVTATIAEWAHRTGLSQETIGYRLRHGWSHQEAVTTPAITRAEPISSEGERP